MKRRGENQRRSLYFASEITARLGNRTAVRQKFCHLRLVRCANELHQLRRLRSESPSSRLSTSTFRDKWPALQVIGKDILVPAHGVYWLIMLHAIGFGNHESPELVNDQMPQLLVHGWWNLGGAKMSKSVGNMVDPFVLADKYGAEAVRYYLMSDIVTGQDADFSEERLVERYNVDLANSLGNLLNRTLTMVEKYQDNLIAFPKGEWLQNPDERSTESYAENIIRQIKAYKST